MMLGLRTTKQLQLLPILHRSFSHVHHCKVRIHVRAVNTSSLNSSHHSQNPKGDSIPRPEFGRRQLTVSIADPSKAVSTIDCLPSKHMLIKADI